MFNLKIINESYNGSDSLYNVINYVICDKETHEYLLYKGGLNIFDVTNSYNEMMYIKEAFRKSDKRQLRHFVVSFSDRCLFIPYVFQVIVEDEIDLANYYESITASIAVDFQSKVEKNIEKWNIYLVFECKNKISLELKGLIEQDKYSTRKLVWDSMEENDIGDGDYLKNRLFSLNINEVSNNANGDIPLMDMIKDIDFKLFQAINSPINDLNHQVAIYLGGNSNEQKIREVKIEAFRAYDPIIIDIQDTEAINLFKSRIDENVVSISQAMICNIG